MMRKSLSAVLGTALVATTLAVGVALPVSAALITSDDFTSGTLAAWTDVTRATVDTTAGSPAAPSMRVAATAQSAFARINLATPANQACVSVNVNLATGDPAGTDLFRLRTAANGAIIRVFVAGNGTVQMRNDFSGGTMSSAVALGTGWHNLELCGTVGAATTWTLYLDTISISTWSTNTGTTAIGRVQLGDTAVKTFTANFDHFVVDNAPGDEPAGPVDTTAPTVPGTPTGSSPSTSSIQLAWTASTDASAPITYRIYRDGNATPIGQTTTLSYTDTGLAAGSSHTYTVDGVDPSGNASAKSAASASITVQSGGPTDTTAPTVPGRPTGTSPSSSSIQVSWTASSDPSTPITYRIFRDGSATPVGQTTSLTYTDTGLAAASAHTYTVDAVDAAGNASARSQASATITVQQAPPAVVLDDFANLSAWTVTRLTLSTTDGSPTAPSARAAVTNQAAYGVRVLGTPMSQACVSVNVNLATGAGIDLFRLRTAASGPIMKVAIATNGALQMRNDLNPAARGTSTVRGTGWHNVELCGTVGATTSWTLYRDGVSINTWATDTGTTPIGLIQLGYTSASTFTANYDHFVVDTSPGDSTPPPTDTAAPTVPGRPTGTAPNSNSIQLSWTASTDASSPITYRIYRDGAATAVGQTTSLSFTDVGLNAGSSHTYTVDAIDPAGNASAKSQASASITVQTAAPAVVFDDFANLNNWTVTRLTLSTTTGSPSAPSARVQVTSQAGYGVRTLGVPMSQACISVNVNLASGTGIDLFRLRTAANGALIKVLVAADGTLQMRNDLNPATRTTTTALGSGWHNVELCGSVGAATSWTLYRDNVSINTWTTNTGTTPIGIIQLGSATAATFTGNVSANSAASAAISVQAPPPAVVTDEFTNLSGWTVTRLTLSTTAGNPAAPSARANPTAQSAYAVRTLPATMSQACISVNVNLASGSGVDLLRLRTATNGALIKVSVAADGTLSMRNDLNPATRATTTQLGTGWHSVELCGTVGTATSWTLYRDGVAVNTWSTNTGTAPIGMVQLGNTSPVTYVANFDHFVVDNAPGG
ncbi:MAG: hypothetical protein HZB15_04840 [Actinobacteria bacterium]|nr:hypothetical protein [Actinomycetota bacterium]